MFHNFKGTDDNDIDEINQDLWKNFKEINYHYVENLREVQKGRDLIWIHDLSLMLTPLYIK